MPPPIPSEVLAIIFSLVAIGDLLYNTLDLFSCCLVCWSWYACALPALERNLLIMRKLPTNHCTSRQLEHVVNMLIASARHGLAFRHMVQRVEIFFYSDFWSPGVPCPGTVVHLLDATRPDPYALTLILDCPRKPKRLQLLHKLRTRVQFRWSQAPLLGTGDYAVLQSRGSTSIVLPTFIRTLGGLVKPPLSPQIPTHDSPALHPALQLFHRLHNHLTQLHISSSHITSALSHTLRHCRSIRTFHLQCAYIDLPPAHLAETIACWPELRFLTIRMLCGSAARSADLLTNIVRVLSRESAFRLETLQFQDNVGYYLDTDFIRLVNLCHASLISLAIPEGQQGPGGEEYNHNHGNLHARLFATPMPVLRKLDLSQWNCFEAYPLNEITSTSLPTMLLWPSLSELVLGSYSPMATLFLEALLARFPRLESVLIRAGIEPLGGYGCMVKVLVACGFKRTIKDGRESKVGPWVRQVDTCGNVEVPGVAVEQEGDAVMGGREGIEIL